MTRRSTDILHEEDMLAPMSHDEARRLTRLYMDGASSISDELRLGVYYARRDVAFDLIPYLPMMRAIAEGAQPPALRMPGRLSRMVWRGAAAVLALSVTVAALDAVAGSRALEATEREYAGSCVWTSGGEAVTDLGYVLATFEQTRIDAEKLCGAEPEGPSAHVLLYEL